MIRRAIWLVIGATLGIFGYRRVARLGRVIAGSHPVPTTAAVSAGRRLRQAWPSAGRRIGRESGSFIRDVRSEMAQYLDASEAYMKRHPGR